MMDCRRISYNRLDANHCLKTSRLALIAMKVFDEEGAPWQSKALHRMHGIIISAASAPNNARGGLNALCANGARVAIRRGFSRPALR